MKDYLSNLRPSTFVIYENIRARRKPRFFVVAVLSVLLYFTLRRTTGLPGQFPANVSARRAQLLEQCKYINTPAGPPPNFHERTHSDRYVPGTTPLWLKNAKIITGARNGTEVIYGDILLDKGLIQAVGYIPPQLLNHPDLHVEDADGAWVTPGLVDLHSHIGVDSSPWLRGAADLNSRKAPILPWLRSIDALNTHDASYELAVSGGVTTAQILPGSGNNIGGQSFVIKLRPTSERSVTSKVLEPPYTLNGSYFDHSLTPRWRHMKHACGENPSRVYSQTRMDSAWEFRQAYNEAHMLKKAQDQFCAKAETGLWSDLGEFPENLQWEALVDVLRGKVKLSVHCYEVVDLDAIVRLSNEFKFPVASFHHGGETYLVPDLLKKTYGGVPSIALFSILARMKRESYRNSEFAMRVLADHGIPVVMKSDHPVVNSRYLMNEAAMAHYYGLKPALALASVTSTPADALGLGHRVGTIREGFDADMVVWDSHPLSLGATPKQVYIDGIPQLEDPHVSPKPDSFQDLPKTPNFDSEAAATVEYDGLPPLTSKRSKRVIFTNVSSIYTRNEDHITVVDVENEMSEWLTVVVKDGIIICTDKGESCHDILQGNLDIIDLQGGSLAPGLTTFGSPIGLVEISMESSTNDGIVYNPLEKDIPSIIGGGELSIIRAVDGLQFGGRNTLLSFHGGVTTAVTAPSGDFLLGMSTAFSVGGSNALEYNAIIQDETALHIAISRESSASVSTQIAAIRRILFDAHIFATSTDYNQDVVNRVREGDIPLVVHTDNADVMASVLHLKAEYDRKSSRRLRLTFAGAAEAHLLAQEIGDAGVSAILTPSRPFPHTWDQRRILPGPPLSYDSAVTALLAKGVNVAIGVIDEYTARSTRFDLAWAALESNGSINKARAIALATTALEEALGLRSHLRHDIVAYRGGDIFDFHSKVVGVISAQRRVVDIF